MGLQELKSSGDVLYSVQSTLLEAGGQVGEVPVAVSREGDLGSLRRRRLWRCGGLYKDIACREG